MTRDDPRTLVIPCRVDVMQYDEHGEKVLMVGRLLADEMRMAAIEAIGEDPYEIADADSGGLEGAYTSLMDVDGNPRVDIDGGDPIVYLYRFVLHPDFYAWKRGVLHTFCESFDTYAAILAQRHTTPLATEDFTALGFRLLPLGIHEAGEPVKHRKHRFMLRENSDTGPYTLSDYIEGEAPPATEAHAAWVKSQGPWRLI